MTIPRASIILLLLAGSVHAGGSYEPVKVQSLSRTSDVDYELVVAPTAPGLNADPYMKGCTRFTVRGTYAPGKFPASVTRENHISALSRLEAALKSGNEVFFGWMGPGFEPEKTDRCIVRSRALEQVLEHEGKPVLSYYGAV
jgi:hypothetical protein